MDPKVWDGAKIRDQQFTIYKNIGLKKSLKSSSPEQGHVSHIDIETLPYCVDSSSVKSQSHGVR